MAEKKPKVKWNEHAIEDDIKFRGPLNYRHFKIAGWALFVGKLTIPLMQLAIATDPTMVGMLATPLSIMELITPLSVFFLLIASLSQLLVKGDYKRQLLTNGGATLAVIAVFELLYHRYIVGSVNAFVGDRFQSLMICDAVFSSLNAVGFMAFNVFLDLFLCTCVMFFLNYEPKKVFVGDKRKWFRCFALLPVIYEFVCLWLKVQANSGDYHMPISFFPFLTAKPPMMFFVFCIMVIRQMFLEKRFCKGGRMHEEYVAYLETNRGTFQFAKFAAVLCLLAGAIDLGIVFSAVLGELSANAGMFQSMANEAQDTLINELITKYANAGFGGSADLLIFAPLMLLFNYAKTYEKTTVELAIPIVSIVVLLVIYLEAGLVAMSLLADIVKTQVMPQVDEMITMIEENEGGEEDLSELFAVLLDDESLAELDSFS